MPAGWEGKEKKDRDENERPDERSGARLHTVMHEPLTEMCACIRTNKLIPRIINLLKCSSKRIHVALFVGGPERSNDGDVALVLVHLCLACVERVLLAAAQHVGNDHVLQTLGDAEVNTRARKWRASE